MKVRPFSQVGDIAFGIAPHGLTGLIGQPNAKHANRDGLTEFDYECIVYRFDASSRLVEITANAPAIELDGHVIPFPLLSGYIRLHDQSAFGRFGFLVSPRFGIAFDPDAASWVTAFPEESLDAWRAIGGDHGGA